VELDYHVIWDGESSTEIKLMGSELFMHWLQQIVNGCQKSVFIVNFGDIQ